MKAIVTGYLGGVGAAVAEALEAADYEVIGLDLATGCNITDSAMVHNALHAHKDATVIVNCAGIEVTKLFGDLTAGDFEKVMAVNVTGTFNVSRALWNEMSANPKPCAIINVSSIWGLDGSPALTPYVASKHAVCGMTKVMAKEGSRLGIDVKCICPTYINTPMVAGLPDKVKAKLRQKINKDNPNRTDFLEPDEVANTILAMINGQINETIYVLN